MRKNPYEIYLENEILSASPIELIQLMYAAALDSIQAARGYARAGDIRAHSCAITKAMRVVTELSRCLNHRAGGDLSRNLANIYGYVLRLLVEAKAKHSEAPLGEALNLLSTLAEGWNQWAPIHPEPGETPQALHCIQPSPAGEHLQPAW